MPSPVMGQELAEIGPWMEGDRPKRFRTVKSAERTLALFELFSLSQRPMGVGEIAKALEIPQPSVSMLVRNLASLGYLEHDRVARTYVPTIRIMLLGSWISRRFSREHNLDRRLDDLMKRTGETVMVGIQNGIYSQYVLAKLPTNPDRMEVQSGLLRPITRTAIGRALLSLRPDTEIEAIVRRCNAEETDERLRVHPKEFMSLMQNVRAAGYARTAGDMTRGRAVIAVTVPCPVGNLPMAVGVGGLVERVAEKEQEILAALMEFKSATPAPDAG